MIQKNKYGNVILIKCDCGDEYMEITKDDEIDDYFINFYRGGNGYYRSWKEKIRDIIDILCDRCLCTQEIILDQKHYDELVKDMMRYRGENNG